MSRIRNTFPFILGALSVVGLAGCGGGGIYGGGGGGPTADFKGNILAVEPGGTGRNIVVWVYTVKHPQDDCTTPDLPDKGTQEQSRTLKDGETEFDVRNAKAGRFVVVFLLDNAGKKADGRIDPGDPVAILNDPDCVMEDVPNKYIVTAADVRINFSQDDVPGFPPPGRAEADDLSEAPEHP